ncbi:hypothetical protein OV015_25465, partial [Salmonella enterica subsp. enterica serovar 1,4,[5],12:i:-]|nr:hypothetical protein [Salmonella enterica subsp. enterica serovar 1,4,[5],12:i:-]
MDNNDHFILFPDLRHGWFDAKIKKPMESYLHASSNDISMNALNTIVANDMENSKLGEAGFDEHDIFSPPSIEEKIYFDDTLPPIYDDYNDSSLLVPPVMEDKFDYDYNMPPIFNDSYFVEFSPTTINKNDYANVGSSNNFMHETHDKNALCDSYIVEFVHDATENYYERGKYGCRNFHVTKTPLYVLKFLKLHLFYLPMLVTLLFMNLFIYKIPMHRKHVRLKFVLNLPLDALFCFKYYFLRVHH